MANQAIRLITLLFVLHLSQSQLVSQVGERHVGLVSCIFWPKFTTLDAKAFSCAIRLTTRHQLASTSLTLDTSLCQLFGKESRT